MYQQQPQQEQEQATSGLEVDTMADIRRKTENLACADGANSSSTSGMLVTWEKESSELILDGKSTASNSLTFCTLTLEAGTYTLSITGLDETGWDKTGFYLSGVDTARVQTTRTYTVTEETIAKIQFVVMASDVTYVNRKVTIMFTKTSTALDYEPYMPHSLRKLSTATGTITTLPIDVYADGTNATVGLKGNMSQTGTPTPQNPIQPSECGDLETSGAHSGQYKIPISSANTTTPVYLEEVETTRYIVKTVLTSSINVDWRKSSTRSYSWYFTPSAISAKSNTPFICSHGATVTTASDYVYGTVYCDNTINLGIFPDNLTTGSEVRSWLDEQYANGTPVVIWTVYISPTTTTLNEPLRKIGDYADTVSGITIPTITGKDSFDVLTTLKPSEVELTYTGWHDASVQEWDGSDWQ